jgi:ELWxxDGT repeat protein
MSRFGWRRPRRSPRSAQRKPTEYALTVSNLEERTMLSLVSGVVADINQQVANGQPGSADPSNLTVLNGALYFFANDGIDGTQLWKSDGTAAGTTMVTDLEQINPAYAPLSGSEVAGSNGTVFFEADSNGSFSPNLYRTDGTPAGTSAIVTPDSTTGFVANAIISGGSLYFITMQSSDSWSGNAVDLWKSNGTSSGTDVVASIPNCIPGTFTDANGKVFLMVNTYSQTFNTGTQLWSSDGTAAGTTEVTSLNGPLEQAAALGNKLVFAQADGTGSGASLWVSDGTTGGTVQLQDFQSNSGPPNSYGSAISSLTVAGGTAYFAAQRGTDLQLWATNGTVAGTVPLTSANAGSGGVNPSSLVPMGGKLYFLGNDPASGQEALWSSDGTVSGTNIIADLGGRPASNPGGGSSYHDQLVASESTLFIVGGNPSSPSGPDLWESDGTAAGTTDLGSLPQNPSNLTADGATLFFTATHDQATELWYAKSSPTPTPTPTPTPKPPSSPSPAPTPPPAPTIIGEQAVFQRRLNKRGKPVGKAVLTGFALEFSRPMSASVLNAADYQLEEVRKVGGRSKLAKVKPVGLTVSYDTSSSTVTVEIAGKQPFAKGGVLTVNTAVASAAGKSLAGNSAFTISPGGKTIGPA